HAQDFEIAIETNGTIETPQGSDWICVSPKAGAPFNLRSGSELKLVYPQPNLLPDDLPELDVEHYFLQPIDREEQQENIAAVTAFCLENPRWRLSLQTHKMIGIP